MASNIWKGSKLPQVVRQVAPTASDISYQVPTLWLNDATDRLYFLVDITAGVATWHESISETLPVTTSTDPAINAAVSTAIVDGFSGVVITLTAAGNSQTIQNPTITTAGKEFIVANNDSSSHSITINSVVIQPGEAQKYFWDLTAWLTLEAVSANQISATPHGDIAATQVQAYLDELEDEKAPIASPTFTGVVTAPSINQTNAIENESKLLQAEDIYGDFVVTGLLPATSATTLISDISLGHAYVTGTRVNKAATSNTYTASVDTYVDVNSAGVYTFPEAALGAAAPAVTADSIRLAKVVTDVDNITGVTDLRELRITADATLSGTPKIFTDYDTDGTPYYRKSYPTKI